jgi:hypothetical protein
VLPPQSTFDGTDTYNAGTADFFTPAAGTWAISSGRYSGTASATAPALSVFKPPAAATPEAYVEWETLAPTAGGGSAFFDYYSPTDFKYVTLDTAARTVTIGHQIKNRWVVDQTFAVTLGTGVDQKLMLALNGTTVTVSLNGTSVGSFSYYSNVVDGSVGLLVRSGTTSFDDSRSLVGTRVISVLDSVAPTLTVPADVVRATDVGKSTAFVSDSMIGTATATDNIGVQSVTRAGVPAGNLFPIGVTTITWTAVDVFGNQTVKTQKVTVTDLERPTIVVPPNVVVRITSGSSAFVSDTQIGTATATDNSGAATLTRTGVPANNIFPLGTTTITYTAVDAAGNRTTVTQTVSVLYPAIVVIAPPGTTASEGTSKTFSLGSFTGGGGSWSVQVNWGDGTSSTLATQPGAMTAAHTYANDRATPYTVTVTVSDASGQSASSSFTVAVANVAPTVKINTPGPGSNLAWKTTYQFKATFSDAGIADTHTCSIAWGDGTSSTGAVSESSGAGTCLSSHAYSSTGNFTISVTVRDSGGATATATSAITVTKTGGSVVSVLGYVPRTTAKPAATTKIQTKAKVAAAKKYTKASKPEKSVKAKKATGRSTRR